MKYSFQDFPNNVQIITIFLLFILIFNVQKVALLFWCHPDHSLMGGAIAFSFSKLWGNTSLSIQTLLSVTWNSETWHPPAYSDLMRIAPKCLLMLQWFDNVWFWPTNLVLWSNNMATMQNFFDYGWWVSIKKVTPFNIMYSLI